ncbi:MAG TPA: class I SAM-dependent methyltransferase [Acidimicrobiales bacterium]|nr:class I SAM-dependent methyltransferase [Acidimicrobiales bacterium]
MQRDDGAVDEHRRDDVLAGATQRDHYRMPGGLAARQSLFAFVDRERSSGVPGIERLDWHAVSTVLDAGCGSGTWMRAVARRAGARLVVGLDLSPGMLAAARAEGAPLLVNGDVQHLPLATSSFDAVLALWMLYHVPDPDRAVGELARVLRGDGTLLVTTNSNMPAPHEELATEAFEAVTGDGRWRVDLGFSAENGEEILARTFDEVLPEPLTTAIAVPGPEPILGLIRSLRGPIEALRGPVP